MGELIWKYANGAELSSSAHGIRLVVARAPWGDGYHYQLLGGAGSAPRQKALASGHRDDLRDAIDAAERAARGYAAPNARAERQG